MKRIYVVFEDHHEGGCGPFSDYICDWYDDKFIEVYDNFQAAMASIRNWADAQNNVVSRKSDRTSEELTVKNMTDPYSNDAKTHMRRFIVSTLLKSS